MDLRSKIDRGFFLNDNVWICYRRNYFQIKIFFNIIEQGKDIPEMMDFPNSLNNMYIELPDRGMSKINNFYVDIEGIITNSNSKVEIIQHTPKRDKATQKKPEIKLIYPGGDLSSYNHSLERNTIVLYERLQFRKATSNNGKRATAQQFYSLKVNLFGQLEDGKQVLIAFIESSPIVVRGRSPGHYNHQNSNSSNGIKIMNMKKDYDSMNNSNITTPTPTMEITNSTQNISPTTISSLSNNNNNNNDSNNNTNNNFNVLNSLTTNNSIQTVNSNPNRNTITPSSSTTSSPSGQSQYQNITTGQTIQNSTYYNGNYNYISNQNNNQNQTFYNSSNAQPKSINNGNNYTSDGNRMMNGNNPSPLSPISPMNNYQGNQTAQNSSNPSNYAYGNVSKTTFYSNPQAQSQPPSYPNTATYNNQPQPSSSSSPITYSYSNNQTSMISSYNNNNNNNNNHNGGPNNNFNSGNYSQPSNYDNNSHGITYNQGGNGGLPLNQVQNQNDAGSTFYSSQRQQNQNDSFSRGQPIYNPQAGPITQDNCQNTSTVSIYSTTSQQQQQQQQQQLVQHLLLRIIQME